MRKGKGLLKKFRGISIILFTLLLFTACSDNQITSNEPANTDLLAIQSVDLAKELNAKTPGLAKGELNVYSISKVAHGFEISSAASVTSFVIDGKTIKISVPENAFDKNKFGERLYIFIRAEKWYTSDGVVYYYECTPGGAEFKEPLVLHQPYQYSGSSSEYLYWYNPDHRNWVAVDGKNLRNGSASFEIHHFSKYAIAD